MIRPSLGCHSRSGRVRPRSGVEGVDGWLPQVHPVALGTNDERDLELDRSGSEL